MRSPSAAGDAGITAPLTYTPKQHFCCIETFPPVRSPSAAGGAWTAALSPARQSSTFAALKHSPVRSPSAAGNAGITAPLTCAPKQHFCCIGTSPPCVLPPPQAVRGSQPSHLHAQAALLLHLSIPPVRSPSAAGGAGITALSPIRPSSTFVALKHSPVRSPSAAGGAGITVLSPARPSSTFAALEHPPVHSLSAAGGAGITAPLTYTPKRRFCCIETCNKYRNMSKSKHLSFVCTVSRHPNCVLSQTKCVGI